MYKALEDYANIDSSEVLKYKVLHSFNRDSISIDFLWFVCIDCNTHFTYVSDKSL